MKQIYSASLKQSTQIKRLANTVTKNHNKVTFREWSYFFNSRYVNLYVPTNSPAYNKTATIFINKFETVNNIKKIRNTVLNTVLWPNWCSQYFHNTIGELMAFIHACKNSHTAANLQIHIQWRITHVIQKKCAYHMHNEELHMSYIQRRMNFPHRSLKFTTRFDQNCMKIIPQ